MKLMKNKTYDNIKEEDISIVERILMKTGNPKLASVLALDLLLVGVDTVSIHTVCSTDKCYYLFRNLNEYFSLYSIF